MPKRSIFEFSIAAIFCKLKGVVCVGSGYSAHSFPWRGLRIEAWSFDSEGDG